MNKETRKAGKNTGFVGGWPAETIWERAERARVFLCACGYLSVNEAVQAGEKIKAAKKFYEHD